MASWRHFAGKFHILLKLRKSESTAFVESLNPQGSTENVEEPKDKTAQYGQGLQDGCRSSSCPAVETSSSFRDTLLSRSC